LVVPKHRHRIVDRNRLKRRLREILRRELLPRLRLRSAPADVLVRARREAYDASFEELRVELVEWVDRRWSHVSSSS
jgi:ribonuclease P protein component